MSRLHHLCRVGNIKEVKEFVEGLKDEAQLDRLLHTRDCTFGNTPLHQAATSGMAEILAYLLERSKDPDIVNNHADTGYTPLHLAACWGHRNCVKTLLEHSADMSLTDPYGKTAKQGAQLSSKGSVVRLLQGEEIVKEVEKNGSNLTELLRTSRELDLDCLNRALMAATQNDNPVNIAKLMVKGAKNLDYCLEFSLRESKVHACAVLLLIKAALSGDTTLLKNLFEETGDKSVLPDVFSDPSFPEVQKAILSGKISTVVPIELARRCGHGEVREELLMKTDVDQDKKCVYWHGLRLLQLDVSWLRRISWVKRIRLARNGFKTLPNDMGIYLQQVVKIDLQHNELATIPSCLLELPNLDELILSHNKLTIMPDVPEWPTCLMVLDLSFNQLDSLPSNVEAPAMRSLNLSHNSFPKVPICICSFLALRTLNLSDNPSIVSLPAEMGRLSMLESLNLDNLNNLNDPPKKLQKDPRQCIQYLSDKLRCARGSYHIKLMLVGPAEKGKTTLVKKLQDNECGSKSTVGVEVSDWWYKPSLRKRKFHFQIWDFRGQQDYYVTHQCFLSQCSLYLLMFSLSDGEAGVEALRPWLNNISLRAPHSMVIIAGTHLDKVPEEKREEVDVLLNRMCALAETYKLQVVEVVPVALKNHCENIVVLREALYNHAAACKTRTGELIMGRKIPASYHYLEKQLEVIRQDIRNGLKKPFMHFKEFFSVVQELNLPDLQDAQELKAAIAWLCDVGALLHYNGLHQELQELYFVDPQWLCDTLSRVVTIKERVSKGILHFRDIPSQDTMLSCKQYLSLFGQFEIALPLNNETVLIPSMLPEERPKHLTDKDAPLSYYRHILFNTAGTPPGFWSRLLFRILHSMLPVRHSLFEIPATEGMDCDASPSQELLSSAFKLPSSLPTVNTQSDEIRLNYWRTGLCYNGPDSLTFRIESLADCSDISRAKQDDGIFVAASYCDQGKVILEELVCLVVSLVKEWYPGLVEDVIQKIPCFECLKVGRKDPFEFNIKNCWPGCQTMKCGYYAEEPDRNHSVDLSDVVPDFVLQDIDPAFHLNANDICCEEDDSSLLGKGSYSKVYRGKYHNQSIAVKRYLTSIDDAISKLHSEAKLLEQCYHPCLVCLVGVCTHPFIALVLEEPPLTSLDSAIKRKSLPIHRLTIFRIAAEVAAALRFLHCKMITFRDLKATNVLLWTLDPSSLCHCKVSDFEVAPHLAPVETHSLRGTQSVLAPEVLQGTCKQNHTVKFKTDVFSFGMLLYHMIARRHPYHDVACHRIDSSVITGIRPTLQGMDVATTGYHYLTMLMKRCWEEDPHKRPNMDDIIQSVSSASLLSVMCVQPTRSKLSLCQAVAVTPASFLSAGAASRLHNELWVCSDGEDGVELSIYDCHNMSKMCKHFIKDNQVQCIALLRDHIWVSSRAGIDFGVIDIFNIASRELVHNIRLRENSVSCITTAKDRVFVGTLEGYCFSFGNEIPITHKPRYRYISEYAVNGIVCAGELVWVSHTKYISFVNPDNLKLEGSTSRGTEQNAFIGLLATSPAQDVVWSAHVGGIFLTAWDAHDRSHSFDVNTCKQLQKVDSQLSERDCFITAMLPALDTVWVGMATGHIIVFHNKDLLTWYQPYNEQVRFLVLVPGSGPCETEKCMIVSGGNGFVSLTEEKMGFDSEEENEEVQDDYQAGVLVVWECFEAEMLGQVKLVEKNSPGYLLDHDSVRIMIDKGGFKDGTHVKVPLTVLADGTKSPGQHDPDSQPNFESPPNSQLSQLATEESVPNGKDAELTTVSFHPDIQPTSTGHSLQPANLPVNSNEL